MIPQNNLSRFAAVRRADRVRSLASRGAKLADPPDHHGGAVRSGQRVRHGGARAGGGSLRGARPAGHHREHRRRRQHDRHRADREVRAGRLPVRVRQRRFHGDRADHAQGAALQQRNRFRRGRAGRRAADRAHHAQGPAAQHDAGVRRLRESEPGQDAVRLVRRRLGIAFRLLAAERGAWASTRRMFPIAARDRPCRI